MGRVKMPQPPVTVTKTQLGEAACVLAGEARRTNPCEVELFDGDVVVAHGDEGDLLGGYA